MRLPLRHRVPRLGRYMAVCAIAAILAACQANPLPPRPAPSVGHGTAGEVAAPTSAVFPVQTPGVAVTTDFTTASSLTVVVTKRRPLDPIDYVPESLVPLADVPVVGEPTLREDAALAYVAMSEAAEADGAGFVAVSAYRSYEEQRAEHEDYVARYGRKAAERASARPGYSEHQTGLAVDVNNVPVVSFSADFGSTAAGTWLATHSHEFGFIISYPADKEHVTGYKWEPWHLRYVGVDTAAAMRAGGFTTLQEFAGLEASPDYG